MNWKAAREAIDAVGADGMSGEETDDEVSGRQKELARVPVRWINPELTRLFHTVDSWKAAIADEGFVSTRGNRPFARSSTIKEPAMGTVTKRLPRNWYDNYWYMSQTDPQKRLLNATSSRIIPTLVRAILHNSTDVPSLNLTLQQPRPTAPAQPNGLR